MISLNVWGPDDPDRCSPRETETWWINLVQYVEKKYQDDPGWLGDLDESDYWHQELALYSAHNRPNTEYIDFESDSGLTMFMLKFNQ